MNKIYVSVFFPTIQARQDFLVPINKTIGSMKALMVKGMMELTRNDYQPMEAMRLYNKFTHEVYPESIYVVDSDIRNGTQLILL